MRCDADADADGLPIREFAWGRICCIVLIDDVDLRLPIDDDEARGVGMSCMNDGWT
jgi:hypothetical protein